MLREKRGMISIFTTELSISHFESGPAGESNPDLLVANQTSSRWTSRPFRTLN